METLEVKTTNALKAFQGTDAKGKKLLADLFGEKVFNQKITDRVKTFEDACEILGIKPSNLFESTYPNGMQNDAKAFNAFYKLTVIARAFNEGWIPDWDNNDQYKYYPYFKMKAGFGFSYTAYDDWGSCAITGSRLCFRTSELAEYAGKQFESIYRDFLTI